MKQLMVLLFVSLFFAPAAMGQNVLSPRANAEFGNVSIDYGQPSKRGRVIFGGLEPYGQVWRTGANEATVVTFKKDGTFGGKQVKAGKYTLFTIPREKDWEIILNSKLEQWGSYDYEKIKGSDVLHVTVPSGKTKETVEKLTIGVTGSEMTIDWDDTHVAIPIKF